MAGSHLITAIEFLVWYQVVKFTVFAFTLDRSAADACVYCGGCCGRKTQVCLWKCTGKAPDWVWALSLGYETLGHSTCLQQMYWNLTQFAFSQLLWIIYVLRHVRSVRPWPERTLQPLCKLLSPPYNTQEAEKVIHFLLQYLPKFSYHWAVKFSGSSHFMSKCEFRTCKVLLVKRYCWSRTLFFVFFISLSVYLLLVPFSSTITTTCPVILHLIHSLLDCYSLPMLIPHLLVSFLPQSWLGRAVTTHFIYKVYAAAVSGFVLLLSTLLFFFPSNTATWSKDAQKWIAGVNVQQKTWCIN